MKKRIRGYHIVMLIFAVLLYLGEKYALTEAADVERKIFYQTVPTPTPTSDSRPPTNTPGSVQPTNESPGPTLTASAQPSQATPTVIDLVETPIGGYVPTSESCGVPPTIQALDLVNVRMGPSTAYETIYRLVFLEVSPIVGRAEHSNWWLISLPDGSLGWVIDNAVSVSGNIYVVPIIDAPPIEGGTAIPKASWYPTPRPQCQPLPTFTPFPLEAEASPDQPATKEVDVETTPELSNTVEPTLEASTTHLPSPTDAELLTNTSTATIESVTIPPTSTMSAPEDNQESSDDDTSWLLYAGLGLVALGILIYVARRFMNL